MTAKTVFLLSLILFARLSFSQNEGEKNAASNLTAYYTRLPFNDQGFTGRYADIVVRIKGKGEFVFSREFGYQPYWQPANGKKQSVKRWIERRGDGPAERPDNHNIAGNAAIVESGNGSVKVHWRYAPDITTKAYTDFIGAYNEAGNPSPFYAGYVDEYFTINSNGTVLREVKKGTYGLADWQNPSATVREQIALTSTGLQSVKLPSLPNAKPVVIKGEVLKKSPVGGAVMHFSFNEGTLQQTTEDISKNSVPIGGVAAYWRKGVSGSCLSFDSYSNAVELTADRTPVLQTDFSIDAWIAPQEYPFNEAPVVDHLKNRQGYFFGLNVKGELLLKIGDGDSVYTITSSPVPLYRWSHVAATVSKNAVLLFINGKEVAALKTTVAFKDAVNAPLSIGATKNSRQYPAGTERDITKAFQTAFVFSGLLDEVALYNRSLTSTEVAAAYTALQPANLQPLKPWLLPETKSVGTFGASYTKLRYSAEWDGLWRVGDYTDLVVNFENSPWRYVFWRGTRYLPSLVTGSGKTSIWSSDQGPEHYSGQCFEHMSDMQCRFSKIRLIHNSPARVVVHWRNSSGSIAYKWPKLDKDGWGIWTDEYWTIYPDGIAIRHQELHNGSGVRIIEMNQNEILQHADQTVNDVLLPDALTLGDADGNLTTYDRRKPEAVLVPKVEKNMQYVNLASATKQFQIGEPGMKMDVDMFKDVWWYGWNHYPAQLIPSDGTRIHQNDRPASSCVATFREIRHPLDSNSVEAYTIYGLTTQKPETLTALNRAWNFAPAVTEAKGVSSAGYNKRTRAFEFVWESGAVSFTINASASSPVYNPAFVFKNWTGRDAKNLSIELKGERLLSSGYKAGMEINTEGKRDLIIWLPLQSAKPVSFKIR